MKFPHCEALFYENEYSLSNHHGITIVGVKASAFVGNLTFIQTEILRHFSSKRHAKKLN